MTSIFQKNCPACATLLRLEDERCECGYVFDGNPETADAAQQAVEEDLFEAYLAARVDQALASLLDARNELAATPGNFDKASQVMRRVHELRVLRDDLDTQRSKSSVARARVEDLRATAASEGSTETFRAMQTARAERIAGGMASVRTCPACQATAASDAAHCPCGYRFESALGGASEDPQTAGDMPKP